MDVFSTIWCFVLTRLNVVQVEGESWRIATSMVLIVVFLLIISANIQDFILIVYFSSLNFRMQCPRCWTHVHIWGFIFFKKTVGSISDVLEIANVVKFRSFFQKMLIKVCYS